METVTEIADHRRISVEIECQTTIKLIKQIMSNNFRVLEGLRAVKNDPNYIDLGCEYLHRSQITIMELNLILQKFVKNPLPVPSDTSMVVFEESKSFESISILSQSPPQIIHNPSLPMLQMSENLNYTDDGSINEVKKETREIDALPCNSLNNGSTSVQVPSNSLEENSIETSCNVTQIAIIEIKKEAGDNTTLGTESVEVPLNLPIKDSIKPSYDFSQIPFKTENNNPPTSIESDFKNVVVEEEDAVPEQIVTELQKPTTNYADILKGKCNKNETKSINMFFPDFSSKNKSKGFEVSWTSSKLSSSNNNSNKFSYKSLPYQSTKVENQIEPTAKPNYSKCDLLPKETKLPEPQICSREIQETVAVLELPESINSETLENTLQDSQSAEQISEICTQRSEIFGSASASIESNFNQTDPQDNSQTWIRDSESAAPSLQSASISDSLQNDKEVPETWNQYLESSSVDTYKSSSPPLRSLSPQTKSSDSRIYYSATQQSKSETKPPNRGQHVKSSNAGTSKRSTFKSPRSQTKSSNSRSYYNTKQQPKSNCRSDDRLKKAPNQAPDAVPDFMEGEEDEKFFIPTSTEFNKTSLWESETCTKTTKGDINVTRELKRNKILSIEERHRQSIPRARMPDISMKPSSIKLSQKQKSILKTDSEEDIEKLFNEDEHYTMVEEDEVEHVIRVVPYAPEPDYEKIFMISNITSPGLFYIHVVNNTSACLEELADQIELIYKDENFEAFSSKFEAKREMGNFFCINVDGFWTRVEVINWRITDDKTKVDVQFIDYGINYETDYYSLRPLPLELYEFPRIAQRCHLADLYPINTNQNTPSRYWERGSNSVFAQLCGDILNTSFKFVTGHYCNIRKSYGIDFKLANDESIADILVKHRLAIRIKNKKTDFFENLGLTNTNHFDSLQRPMEQMWNAYWYNENTIMKASKDHSQKTPYHPTSRTGNKNTENNELVVIKPYSNQDLPSEGEKRRIMITHVVDIETFYAHIDNGYNVHPGESLSNLHEFMNRYNMTKTYRSLTCTPEINQLVIAPHPTYLWSRAQVRQIGVPDENGEVYAELFYIDYGCIEWVPLSSVRNIVKVLLEFPCLAIEFKMYNIEHKLGANYKMEKEFLELYCNAELIVVVKAVPGHVVVQLQDEYSIDIGETLINHGIGQWKQDHIFPSGNGDLLID